MNTAGEADGALEAWVDGAPVLALTDFVYRVDGATFGIDAFFFSTYFGGTDLTYSPKMAQDARLRRLHRLDSADQSLKPRKKTQRSALSENTLPVTSLSARDAFSAGFSGRTADREPRPGHVGAGDAVRLRRIEIGIATADHRAPGSRRAACRSE